ncbi:hypothetical protein KAH94_06135, partial [bacterium]|nr:hypothetical protein [bacterium]
MKRYLSIILFLASTTTFYMLSSIGAALSVVGTDVTPKWNIQTLSKLNFLIIREAINPNPNKRIIAHATIAHYLQDTFKLLAFTHKLNIKRIKFISKQNSKSVTIKLQLQTRLFSQAH